MGQIDTALTTALDPESLYYSAPRASTTMARALKQYHRVPQKTDAVLYHDPISREACAAIVCKAHHPGEPDSVINLRYTTEEGLEGPACNVAHGTGQFGTWSWPAEAKVPEIPDGVP